MSGLAVEYGHINGHGQQKSWCVIESGGRNGILKGFGRRRDAEIAAATLIETGIDFEMPAIEVKRALVSHFGDDWRTAAMKQVCERLQW